MGPNNTNTFGNITLFETTTEPAQKCIPDSEKAACVIFGSAIDGVVCGFGLAIIALFLLLLLVIGIVGLISFVKRKYLHERFTLSGFKAKLKEFLELPAHSIPKCMLLGLYESVASERFQTWRTLASMHGISCVRLSEMRDSGLSYQMLSEFTLTKIFHQEHKLYTVENLITDLVNVQREDTVFRIIMHLDRCLPCKEHLYKMLHSRKMYHPSVNADQSFEILTVDKGGNTENLLSADELEDSGRHDSELTFWMVNGKTRLISDPRNCIREILHREFELSSCFLLKEFYGLRKWPDKYRFDFILGSTRPAEMYWQSFLGKQPNYTYKKLRRDLKRLGNCRVPTVIADHFASRTCNQCELFLTSDEYESSAPRHQASSAVMIVAQDHAEFKQKKINSLDSGYRECAPQVNTVQPTGSTFCDC